MYENKYGITDSHVASKKIGERYLTIIKFGTYLVLTLISPIDIMVRRVDRTEHRSLMIQVDGEEKGGVQIPETRDSDQSVVLVMKTGLTQTTGLHWHERKDGT